MLSKGNISLQVGLSPSHPTASGTGHALLNRVPLGFHDSPHFLGVLFPVEDLSPCGCALGLRSRPSSRTALTSFVISSLPVLLNTVYMLMTYGFMSPVQKAPPSVRLIYPLATWHLYLDVLQASQKKRVKMKFAFSSQTCFFPGMSYLHKWCRYAMQVFKPKALNLWPSSIISVAFVRSISSYSQFLLSEVVLCHKVAENTDLANTKPLLLVQVQGEVL